MNRRYPPLEPELEAFLSSRKVESHVPPDVRANALARARTIVAARGDAPPRPAARPTARPFAEGAVSSRRSRFGLVRVPLVASLAVVLVAAGVFAALDSRRSPTDVMPSPPASSPPTSSLPSHAVTPPAALVAPIARSEAELELSPPVVSPAPEAQVRRGARRRHAPQARHRVGQFEAELALLQPAHEAYEKGDFSGMLRILQEHARAFPRGRLAEEREALRVESLRRLGRQDEAHVVARAFVVRFPQSVFLSHVRDSLP